MSEFWQGFLVGAASMHRKLFRPSAAPALEKCSHYEPIQSTSPNAERGAVIHKELHEQIPELFTKTKGTPASGSEPPKYVKYALQVLVDSGLEKILGAESLVSIEGKDNDYITEGTADFFGNRKQTLMVYDWKSGNERDYSAQVTLYALALMQQYRIDDCVTHEVFVDQERTYVTELTRSLAEERIFAIVDRVRDPKSPHVINKFCDWCDLRITCPAWRHEQQKFAAELPASVESITLAQRLEQVKADPAAEANFIVKWKSMQKYVKNSGIETHCLEAMKAGESRPGLRLQLHSSGSQYIALERNGE